MKTFELTQTEIMQRFKHEGVEVNIYWNGGAKCSYAVSVDGIEIARGNDFRPAPIRNIDDVETMVYLLAFMTVKPGDTDDEYFKDHTPAHMAWLDTMQCDEIRVDVSDFEDKNSVYHTRAVLHFKKNVELYPQY